MLQLWGPLNFLATVLQPLLKSPAPPLLHVAALGQKQGILGAQPQLIFQPHRIPPLFPQKREYQWYRCWGMAVWGALDEWTCNFQAVALRIKLGTFVHWNKGRGKLYNF